MELGGGRAKQQTLAATEMCHPRKAEVGADPLWVSLVPQLRAGGSNPSWESQQLGGGLRAALEITRLETSG